MTSEVRLTDDVVQLIIKIIKLLMLNKMERSTRSDTRFKLHMLLSCLVNCTYDNN